MEWITWLTDEQTINLILQSTGIQHRGWVRIGSLGRICVSVQEVVRVWYWEKEPDTEIQRLTDEVKDLYEEFYEKGTCSRDSEINGALLQASRSSGQHEEVARGSVVLADEWNCFLVPQEVVPDLRSGA